MNEKVNRRLVETQIKMKIPEEWSQRQHNLIWTSKQRKTCNEEALVVKLEKGNNLRIFCSTTPFEGVLKIVENTVKATK